MAVRHAWWNVDPGCEARSRVRNGPPIEYEEWNAARLAAGAGGAVEMGRVAREPMAVWRAKLGEVRAQRNRKNKGCVAWVVVVGLAAGVLIFRVAGIGIVFVLLVAILLPVLMVVSAGDRKVLRAWEMLEAVEGGRCPGCQWDCAKGVVNEHETPKACGECGMEWPLVLPEVDGA